MQQTPLGPVLVNNRGEGIQAFQLIRPFMLRPSLTILMCSLLDTAILPMAREGVFPCLAHFIAESL